MARSDNSLTLQWKRPDLGKFPKIWHTFTARDIDSDDLVEYRIQDLPLDRADEFLEYMLNIYIPDEPIGKAFNAQNDPLLLEDYRQFYKALIAQRMALVCFKTGSDEIVGANDVYVIPKDDGYAKNKRKKAKSHATKQKYALLDVFFENFDTYEEYAVNEYMTCLGLVVSRKYRGRGIGDQFLIVRRKMCQELGIKLTQSMFTSDYSKMNADRAGYRTELAMEFAVFIPRLPQLAKQLTDIKSKQLTLMSWVV